MKLDQDYGRDIDTGVILRRHLATANLLRQRRALAKWGDRQRRRRPTHRPRGELLQRRPCQRLPRDRQRRALRVGAPRDRARGGEEASARAAMQAADGAGWAL